MEDVLKLPTVLMRWFWCNSCFMLIAVGILCCISCAVVNYLHISFSGLISSVGEETADFSAIDYS